MTIKFKNQNDCFKIYGGVALSRIYVAEEREHRRHGLMSGFISFYVGLVVRVCLA
jgi:hypothetical protein